MEVEENPQSLPQGHPRPQENEFSPDFLKLYYGRLFPYAEMHKWLSYGNDGKHPGCDTSYFSRREFSFTLEHDIYLRYLSFHDAAAMEAAIREKCPHKIDIGAVYNVEPTKRTAYSSVGGDKVFSPVERELVFDVDMTDYDDIRSCCSGADICLLCWPLMTIAVKVVDTALRDDFGFEHILWVYSGRRGVHCWVCDSRARRLTNEQRSSIAEYFRVCKGNEMNGKKVAFTGPALHPCLLRAYTEVLKKYFEEKILPNQNLLAEENFMKVLEMVPDENLRSQMRIKWQSSSSSNEEPNSKRWKQLKTFLEQGKSKGQALRRCVEEIIFSYTYPRLDMEVSKHMNHLLKAPFCVHPKTGRVCIPIDPNNCEAFNPLEVPTLSKLLDELNRVDTELDPRLKDWERTSLANSIHFFRSSVLEPLARTNKAELESSYRVKLQEMASKPNLSW
ncbi:hypothetical protein R1sor_018147 [Riccia sorocarpa]|uniref:DNA primase n=1 Tax=Riccia sorocarpa TaxID=122646 RepID=A0ABD3I8U5_9MARC